MMFPSKEEKQLIYEIQPWVESIIFDEQSRMIYVFKPETPKNILSLFKKIKKRFAGIA